MHTHSYFRKPSAHWCFVQGFCVVLDVEHNRYLSIPADAMAQLLPYIAPTTAPTPSSSFGGMPEDAKRLAQELTDAGILTTEYTPSHGDDLSTITPPTRLLPQFPTSLSVGELRPYILTFLQACTITDWHLRYRPLSQILLRTTSRRAIGHSSSSDCLLEGTTHLTSVFTTLRPFYPRRYRCLFDCLALIEFLSHWNLFPRLIFGVLAAPFRAHCWLQIDDLVLCDTRDFQATRFVPILAV